MGLKFVIQPDHIPDNNYRLLVSGLPPITFINVGSLEKELDTVDLPDRTQASTGRTKPGETEVKVPAHHLTDVAAMSSWYQEGQDPVSPTYKKTASLTNYSGTGLLSQTITIIGLFVFKDATPDLDMKSDGDMSDRTFTMKWDDWF